MSPDTGPADDFDPDDNFGLCADDDLPDGDGPADWRVAVEDLVRLLNATCCSGRAAPLSRAVADISTDEAELLEGVYRDLAHLANDPPPFLSADQYRQFAMCSKAAVESVGHRRRQIKAHQEIVAQVAARLGPQPQAALPPADDRLPPSCEESSRCLNSIRRMPLAWEVRFGDEVGVFPHKGWSVLAHVVAAVAQPHKPIKVCAAPGAKDDVADGRALDEVKRRRDAVLNEIKENSRVREANQNDRMVLKECDEKFERLQADLMRLDAYRDAAKRPGGRKKLGTGEADQAWDSFRNLLKALYPRLRDEAKMPMFADHLQHALLPAKPLLTYNPPLVIAPWTVEL